MTGHNQAIGKWGEAKALFHLEQNGYSILFKNWKSMYGEMDIICRKADTLVFVEVKTRTGTNFGWPEEAVTKTKREHLVNTAMTFFDEHPEFQSDTWQIDVIAILIESQGREKFSIKHYENAVTGE